MHIVTFKQKKAGNVSTYIKKITTYCGLGVFGLASVAGVAQANDKNSQIQSMLSKPKLSKALRDVAKPLPRLTPSRVNKMRASGDKVPGEDLGYVVPNFSYPMVSEYLDKAADMPADSVIQYEVTSGGKFQRNSASNVTIGTGFDGLGNVTGVAPPDTNADVGPNHIVQTVNVALGVWDKEGNELLAPTAINVLWDGFGGLCESNNNGDPIVLYDSQADRWMITQFAFPSGFNNNRACIAISQTGDPTGEYYLYDFLYSDVKFNDYPHYGVWTDAYYAGVNQFTGNSFTGSGVVAYERDKMLAGQPAQQVIIDLETSQPDAFTPMPADIDGIFLPPNDMPGIFVTADNPGELNVWHFDVDWNDTTNSSFTLADTLTVGAYSGAVCSFSRDCIEQPNTQNLDAIGQRMMFRLAYRNLGGTQHKLVANHTVIGSATDNNIAGVRWYEIDLDDAGMPTLAQNGTFNLDDGNSRWMGSAAMDAVGNIGVGYSVSGEDLFPSIRFSGRSQSDPDNVLTVPELEIKAGEASQGGVNRWGDYSSLSIDPTDDCTMWYTTEYYKAENDDTRGWSTYIGSVKFDDCVAGPSGTITGTITDTAGNPIADAQVTIGALTARSNSEGVYTATLPVGDDFTVSAFKYGWNGAETADVAVVEDEETAVDFSLEAATPVTVTGVVADGSGLGSPLFAEIVVDAPGTRLTTYTNPVTGAFSMNLFEGTLIKMTAMSADEGYIAQSVDFTPAADSTQNFDLTVLASCTAKGYGFTEPSFAEDFTGGVPPTGWTIADNGTTGGVWEAGSGSTRGDLLGSGEAAMIDSDAAGPGLTSSTLTSSAITVADLSSSVLVFDSWFRTYVGGDVYNLEISVDGGAWATILEIPATNRAERLSVDLDASISGATSFQLRWNYTADWEWYAIVDNIAIGGNECVALDGSIVRGIVTDANTMTALNGATVSTQGDTVTTMSTGSAEFANGYFSIFVPADEETISVSFTNYETSVVAAADVEPTTPVALNAPQFAIADSLATVNVTQGRVGTSSITLENTGTASGDYLILFTTAPAQGSTPEVTGPFHSSSRHFGPKNLTDLDATKARYVVDQKSLNLPQASSDVLGGFGTPQMAFPWGVAVDQDTGNFYLGDLAAGGAPADAIFEYDSTGAFTGNTIDNAAVSAIFSADMAYNNRTGMLWQVEVGDDNCIHEIDPVALEVTGQQICPAFGTSQRGLTYDPITNTFYSGSWNDSIIHQFTVDGTLLRSVNVGLSISGLALNPVSGKLYVMQNTTTAFDVVVLDANSAEMSALNGFNLLPSDALPVDPLAGGEQSGLAAQCDGTLWTPSRSLGGLIAFESGETNFCDWKNLPWVSQTSMVSGSVAAGESTDIELEFDTNGIATGSYSAQMITSGNTPYADSSTAVSLGVFAPVPGDVSLANVETKVPNGQPAIVMVNRVGGSDFAVSVDFELGNGTAKQGTHFIAVEGTLTWEDGDTSPKAITINTVNTDLSEDLGFSVVLTQTTGGAEIIRASTAVVIEGDKKKSDGGSLGFLLVALLTLGGLARRRYKF
ncbi:MAG: hypothetical protein ACI9O6_002304 [Glaciecola sp.]|jgi:hypothetical protein